MACPTKMSDDRPSRYCHHRLDGMDMITAATEVGYSAGRPSPKARELYARVEALHDNPEVRRPSGELKAQADALELRMRRLQDEMRKARAWFQAAQVMERWEA